jgi:hypothetical protein
VKPCRLVAETWACHEALRRAGFRADDIYIIANANDGEVYVQLQAQGKEFNLRVGPRGISIEDFQSKWSRWCVDIQTIAEDELQQMWESSLIRGRVVQLVADLTVKGFRLVDAECLN